MAELIPTLNSCIGRMQAGEKRLALRLVSHLEDDYLCWYEMPVGVRQKYSDFIVLHPNRGLLLLEVKDWKLDTLRSIDRSSATLLTNNGLKTVSNPLEQVRQCAYQLVNRLQGDSQLIHHSGRYQGNLIFPYGYGVVLSNITRKQFDSTNLGDVLPEHQTICKDEMVENTDPEQFQERLWAMFNVHFATPLTLPQIDRIRWHLFPEIRIATGDLFGESEETVEDLAPDIVRVMDAEQEKLARSLGEGHRVIHGVAGSGKTLILGYRCLHLAKLLHKPILVLCYNIALAARLREMIEERGIGDKVSIYHFHDWCGEQLRTYHVAKPESGHDFFDRLVEAVIGATESGRIPRGQYGAVMIDEGHDFQADWLKLVVGMVDPDTNSLLLLYDDAQSIYAKKQHLDFSLSSVGVQARGRTRVLKINYRNTDEILAFSYGFACRYFSPSEKEGEGVPLLAPEGAGRHGPKPAIRTFDCFDQEAAYIAHLFGRLNIEQGVAWPDMAVLYRSNWMGEKLKQALERGGVPVHWLGTSKSKKQLQLGQDSVKLMTMHSSKGLEFPVVAVSGIGYMPVENADRTAEAKLLYVAMTRATEKLLLTSHRESEFLTGLLEAQDRPPAGSEGTNPSSR